MVDGAKTGNRIQMVVDRMEMTLVRQLNYIPEYKIRMIYLTTLAEKSPNLYSTACCYHKAVLVAPRPYEHS